MLTNALEFLDKMLSALATLPIFEGLNTLWINQLIYALRMKKWGCLTNDSEKGLEVLSERVLV